MVDPNWDPFTSWGISVNVRPSTADVVISSFGFGTIVILLLMQFVYWLVRFMRPKQKKSKADRPSWVFALTMTGCVWIYMTLQTTGVIYGDPEEDGVCSWYRFVGEYLCGWSLWVSLVMYKLLRKYVQLRMVKTKPPHALFSIMIMLLPAALYCIPASLGDSYYSPSPLNSGRGEYHTCVSTMAWLSPLYGLMIVWYTVLFVFFMYKIRKVIGAHHQVIRYGIFISVSMLFPIMDALVHLIPLLGDYWPWLQERIDVFPIPYPYTDFVAGTWFEQMLAVLAIFIVLFNMAHIYVLVLKPKERVIRETSAIGALVDDNLRPADRFDGSVSSDDEDAGDDSDSDDEETSALDDINRLLTDVELEGQQQQHTSHGGKGGGAMGGISLNRSRREKSSEMLPSFEKYIDETLDEEQAAEIDHGRGFFAPKSSLSRSLPMPSVSPRTVSPVPAAQPAAGPVENQSNSNINNDNSKQERNGQSKVSLDASSPNRMNSVKKSPLASVKSSNDRINAPSPRATDHHDDIVSSKVSLSQQQQDRAAGTSPFTGRLSQRGTPLSDRQLTQSLSDINDREQQ